MAIDSGSLISVTIGGVVQAQQWMNVWTFKVGGTLSTPTAGQIGEALWNDFTTDYRALISSAHSAAFQFVRVRELDSLTGDYGEYAVPVGEQAGTLAVSTTTYLPSFNAAGIRLTVGTRVTRPGQKRIPGQRGEDISSLQWVSAYLTRLATFATTATSVALLGAPVAGTELQPVVVSIDRTTGLPTASQNVIGYVVNPYVTSQVSRKIGRGV